jgi:hypothetical protein
MSAIMEPSLRQGNYKGLGRKSYDSSLDKGSDYGDYESMEGTHGSQLPSVVKEVIAGHQRFPKVTDEKIIDSQLERKEKLIRRIECAQFVPRSEEEFED